MATLRDIRRHIRSVRNIEQMTRAMQMVSAAKIRRAQVRVEGARPYALAMDEVARDVAKIGKEYRHPFIVPREEGTGLLILVTSDRGRVGALNVNTMRAAHARMRQEFGPRYQVVAIGRKGLEFATRMQLQVVHHKQGLPDRVNPEELRPAVEAAVGAYLEDGVRAVYLAYARFRNLLSQVPTVRELVPVPPAPEEEGPVTQGDYIYEPGAKEVLERFMPAYLLSQVYQAVLENQASEHSARMVAMRNASTKAGDVIKGLSLTANKVRQANVTRELMEIIGGAEALKAARR
ncbi:MAG: ATP synthase F1 subunit gamma [Candidatus Dormiibacterota bacterium]